MVVEVDAWPPLSLRVNVVVADEPASLRRDTGATSTTVSNLARVSFTARTTTSANPARVSRTTTAINPATNHLRSNDNTSINLNITVTLDPERPCSLVSKFHRKGRS
ncbi:hypothetical protein CC2G_008297 [Coprinopsis cinerea AmutBmut pab1-1]|nr:hypothetical protein CC2G_008297 [Coprinopsis cinerea AmutBmut pab1-1]